MHASPEDGALTRGIGAMANAGRAKGADRSNAVFGVCQDQDNPHRAVLGVFARRDIYGGQEILVNYGRQYQIHDPDVRYWTTGETVNN